MTAYADTSFLVSLYAIDLNSAAASNCMRRAELPLLLTNFGALELLNALSLRVFRKKMSSQKLAAAYKLYEEDSRAGVLEMRNVSSATFETAELLARSYTPKIGTRTLDVLHVASALTLGAERFYTFDRNQATLARAAQLSVLPGRISG